jgi:hypothetical protein
MKFLATMTPAFIRGNRHERARVLGAVGVRFALGAFVVACLQHYLDPIFATDLSSNVAPVVGGAVAAFVGTFLKSV